MRRGPANALLLAALVVLAGCASVVGPAATSTPDGERQVATVIDVIDGDTVEVRLPDGSTDTVRLLGIDTPEVYAANEPAEFEGVPETDAGEACLRDAGQNASAFMTLQLLDASVTLVFDPRSDRRGSYGRLLAYVQRDGDDVNRRLVATGHARVYESAFSRAVAYYDLEATAQSERRGLWRCRRSVGAATPTPAGAPRLVELPANALWADGQHRHGEYVALANATDQTLDPGGWTLADVANHRSTVPGGVTLGPGEQVTVDTGERAENATRRSLGSGGGPERRRRHRHRTDRQRPRPHRAGLA